MRKSMTLFLILTCLTSLLTGCAANADQHTGEAQGYGGVLKVTVQMNGADITRVEVTEHHETEGVGTRAIDALPSAIVQADSVDVDDVSGATVTSQAIKEAVSQATGLTRDTIPMNTDNATEAPALDDGVLTGVGMAATGRVGPGKDSVGGQVYSFNVVFASGVFDENGRILHMALDQLEVVSPNLGAGSMFSGFPDGDMTKADFLSEVSAWQSKGTMGDDYMLQNGSWRDQMNAYTRLMKGKTVDEVMDWYTKYFDKDTGHPLKEGDLYDALTDAEKKVVADVTSAATISLQGEYGDVLLAIQRAWEDAQRNQDKPANTMVDTNTPTDVTDDATTVG